MSDNPDSGIAEDQEMTSHLLGLLYPDEGDSELGDESDYSDTSELSDFRTLLGHFREMPEEQPPPAISNKLLAMAAQHAPAEKKDTGKGFFAWLSDVLLPTVYHPGLASAASLVLIAGLAGTLYVNGKSQVTEPQVATQATAPQEEAALGTATLGDPSDVPAASLEDSSEALAKTQAEEEPLAEAGAARAASTDGEFEKAPAKERALDGSGFKAELERDSSLDETVGGLLGAAEGKGGSTSRIGNDSPTKKNRRTGAESPAVKSKQSEIASQRRGRKLKPSVATTPTDSSKDAKPKAPKSPVAKPVSVSAPRAGDKTTEPAPEPRQTKSPGPAPAPPGVGDEKVSEESADDDAFADEEATASEPEESKVNPAVAAAAIHKKAIAAAKKKDCRKVKSFGQAIRKLSSSYYDRTFLSDKRLTDCLAPDVKK